MKTLALQITIILLTSSKKIFAQTDVTTGSMDMKIYTEWMLFVLFIMVLLVFLNLIISHTKEDMLTENLNSSPGIILNINSIHLSEIFLKGFKAVQFLLISVLILFFLMLLILMI